jgi:prepilin-type N-terminal cleavage/methylation domain-containing protein
VKLYDGERTEVDNPFALQWRDYDYAQRATAFMALPETNKIRAQGFSLIELLVVLALLIVLVTLMNSRGSRSNQQKRMAVCEKNLQTIYTALSLYAPEPNSPYPMLVNAKTSEEPLSLLVPKCTTVTEIFICPGSSDKPLPPGESFAERKVSYSYYMGFDKSAAVGQALITDAQVDTSWKKAGSQIFSPDGKGAGNNHDRFGGNILCVDGSITSTKAKASGDLLVSTNIVLLNPRR